MLGGPHVTLIPGDAQDHADTIVVGYAEDTWPELLRDFTAGMLKTRYDQSPNLDLANRPFARRDLLPVRATSRITFSEATRGCVHDCDFCVVPAAWGRKPYQKPVDQVIEDIRREGARKLIFVDLNLIADRRYAMQLFTALVPLRVQWYGLATVLLANDAELLDAAAAEWMPRAFDGIGIHFAGESAAPAGRDLIRPIALCGSLKRCTNTILHCRDASSSGWTATNRMSF